jgi:hypothetical protein
MRRRIRATTLATGLVLPIQLVCLASPLLLAACESHHPGHAAEPATAVSPLQFAEVANPGETKGVTEYATKEGSKLGLRAPRAFPIKSVRRTTDGLGYPAIEFEIDGPQQEAFRTWTAGLIGRRLAILVDGNLLTAPMVKSALPGHGVIESGAKPWTDEEVDSIVARIQGVPPK